MEKVFLFVIFFGFLFVSFVSGFDVTSFYLSGEPLGLNPGEIRETSIVLRNFDGIEGDADFVEAKFVDDANIAELVDGEGTIYEIPFGGEKVSVPLILRVSEDANIGELKEVDVKFTGASGISGEAVTFEKSLHGKIYVKIVGRPELEPTESGVGKGSLFFWSLVTFLILGIAIIGIVIKKEIKKRDLVQQSYIGQNNYVQNPISYR